MFFRNTFPQKYFPKQENLSRKVNVCAAGANACLQAGHVVVSVGGEEEKERVEDGGGNKYWNFQTAVKIPIDVFLNLWKYIPGVSIVDLWCLVSWKGI